MGTASRVTLRDAARSAVDAARAGAQPSRARGGAPARAVLVPAERPHRRRHGQLRRARRQRRPASRQLRRVPGAGAGQAPLACTARADEETPASATGSISASSSASGPTPTRSSSPGDMLYLPPGFAHHGVAVDAVPHVLDRLPRAGASARCGRSFAAHAASTSSEGAQLLVDPPLAPARTPAPFRRRCSRAFALRFARMTARDDAIDRWLRVVRDAARAGPRAHRAAEGAGRSERDRAPRARRRVVRSEEGDGPSPARAARRAPPLCRQAGVEVPATPPSSRARSAVRALRRRASSRGSRRSAAARALIVRLFGLGGLAFAGRA